MEKEVIRKPDPAVKRKNIYIVTLNKVKSFLKNQKNPVYKSDIVKRIGIDYNSLVLALALKINRFVI